MHRLEQFLQSKKAKSTSICVQHMGRIKMFYAFENLAQMTAGRIRAAHATTPQPHNGPVSVTMRGPFVRGWISREPSLKVLKFVIYNGEAKKKLVKITVGSYKK